VTLTSDLHIAVWICRAHIAGWLDRLGNVTHQVMALLVLQGHRLHHTAKGSESCEGFIPPQQVTPSLYQHLQDPDWLSMIPSTLPHTFWLPP